MINTSYYSIVFILTIGVAPTATAQLVINELDYDQPSIDDAEFIEIMNTGTSSVNLNGYALQMVNGGTAVYKIINLPARLRLGSR